MSAQKHWRCTSCGAATNQVMNQVAATAVVKSWSCCLSRLVSLCVVRTHLVGPSVTRVGWCDNT